MPPKAAVSPEVQLKLFIGKFTPEMGAKIRAARSGMRRLLPGAVELVYDNYNFFVIGYGPGERTSEAVFSPAAHASAPALESRKRDGEPCGRCQDRWCGGVIRGSLGVAGQGRGWSAAHAGPRSAFATGFRHPASSSRRQPGAFENTIRGWPRDERRSPIVRSLPTGIQQEDRNRDWSTDDYSDLQCNY